MLASRSLVSRTSPDDEVAALYRACDVFVLPYRGEGFGMPIAEAMASGLPVLVSNRCGCARDLVKEGENGFTFDPSDVEQLAHLMAKLSARDFPFTRHGEASRAIIANCSAPTSNPGIANRVGRKLPMPSSMIPSMNHWRAG